MVDALGPADIAAEKVAYSAFCMSGLEWLLGRAGITELLVGGIVTNGGVASTMRDMHVRDLHVRDLHVRDLHVNMLEDGCAAMTCAVHDAAMEGLRPVAGITSVAAVLPD